MDGSLLQITFVCLIYPVLVLCYAGQAAFISKNFHYDDYNHLSESIPSKLIVHLLNSATVVASSANYIYISNTWNECEIQNQFATGS